MFSQMEIDSNYKIGTLGPWTFYRVEEGIYVFIVDQTNPAIELVEGSDNFVIVTADSFPEAIHEFTSAMGG
jgi:hypothetical protein